MWVSFLVILCKKVVKVFMRHVHDDSPDNKAKNHADNEVHHFTLLTGSHSRTFSTNTGAGLYSVGGVHPKRRHVA